ADEAGDGAGDGAGVPAAGDAPEGDPEGAPAGVDGARLAPDPPPPGSAAGLGAREMVVGADCSASSKRRTSVAVNVPGGDVTHWIAYWPMSQPRKMATPATVTRVKPKDRRSSNPPPRDRPFATWIPP